MKAPEPQKEHKWLQRMVGEWTCEGEASMGPDQPPMKWKATESVRSIGGVWTVGEGSGAGPDGTEHLNIMTLGYDPDKKRFQGSFVGSMMTNMWVYDGALDEATSTLTLDTEGPSMAEPGKIAKYQDIVVIKSDDERTLSSRCQGPDGKWQEFMTATYLRKK